MALKRLLIAGFVASGIMLTLATIPAAATTTSAAQTPDIVTLTKEISGQPQQKAVLTCDPVGGNHPHAAAACALLTAAHGDIASLPVVDPHRICSMLYQPVTVSAMGLWRGLPLVFKQTYSNSCVADNRTGELFDF